MNKNILDLQVEIFPFAGVEIAGQVLIRDHVNLSGSSPKDIGFVPITDLYFCEQAESNGSAKDLIKVACLKDGIKPSAEEEAKLKEAGVVAYTYSLKDHALQAAASSTRVRASARTASLPKGFKALGVSAGTKRSGRKDVGVIAADVPCKWTGVFTQNKVRAVCVDRNEAMLAKQVRAIVCNSGVSNTCTGKEGDDNDQAMRETTAKKIGVSADEVLCASTGKIGVQLEIDKITKAIKSTDFAASDNDAVIDFASSILTSDLVTKVYRSKHILGFAKGSGMIHPNMATMLGFLITDAKVEGMDEKAMQEILREVTDESFNAISVDGDVSTNDMVLLLSSEQGETISKEEFKAELKETCVDLAKKIVDDGEGTTKVVEVNVSNAKNKEEAMQIAKSIITSNLVKTATFGLDPNWGRIVAAIGYSGIDSVDPSKLEVDLLGETVYKKSVPVINDCESRAALSEQMKKHRTITIDVNMDCNKAHDIQATAWGSDLSYKYVEINAEYFT